MVLERSLGGLGLSWGILGRLILGEDLGRPCLSIGSFKVDLGEIFGDLRGTWGSWGSWAGLGVILWHFGVLGYLAGILKVLEKLIKWLKFACPQPW